MNVVNRELLAAAGQRHADAKPSLDAWLAEVLEAKWAGPVDIKRRYASASFLAGNVVIFNVRGNRYRLAVKANYGTQLVLVKWFGTHAEYDKQNF